MYNDLILKRIRSTIRVVTEKEIDECATVFRGSKAPLANWHWLLSIRYEVVKMLSTFTNPTSQYKLISAATCMDHLVVYHEISGTQVVIDLLEFLGS